MTRMIAILSLNDMDFVGFMTSTGHGGNISCGTPPQSLAFPITDIALAFLKTPSVGTSPSISLNERFNFLKNEAFLKLSELNLTGYFLNNQGI